MVQFFRDGNNLTTSCTCRAGQNRRHCKHRFQMMEGDITNLKTKNFEDISRLHQMFLGTDVESAFRPVYEGLVAKAYIESKLSLKPNRRRKIIDAVQALEVLKNDGVMKGFEYYYFDIFDGENNYAGSLKALKGGIFSTNGNDLFGSPGLLMGTIRTDRLVHARSRGVYWFFLGSKLAKAIQCESELKENKRRLQVAMTD